MRSKLTLLVFLLFLLPSTLFAFDEVKTGYDLYHILRLMDNPQNPEDITNGVFAVGCQNP